MRITEILIQYARTDVRNEIFTTGYGGGGAKWKINEREASGSDQKYKPITRFVMLHFNFVIIIIIIIIIVTVAASLGVVGIAGSRRNIF